MNIDTENTIRVGRLESDAKRCYTGFEPVNNSYKSDLADIAQEGLMRPVATRVTDSGGPNRGIQSSEFDNYANFQKTRTDTVVMQPAVTNMREIQRNSCFPLFFESHMIDSEFRGKDADTMLRPSITRWTSNGENLYAMPWDMYLQHVPNGEQKPVDKENDLMRSTLIADRLDMLPSSTETELHRFVGGFANAVETWSKGGIDTRNKRVQACAL